MKTLLFAILLLGMFACKKEEPIVDQKPNVYFLIENDNCTTLPMSYVLMNIDGNYYHIHIDDVYKQTCPIPLSNGIHIISDFRVYNNNNTLSDLTDDIYISYMPDINTNPNTIFKVENGYALIEIKVKCK